MSLRDYLDIARPSHWFKNVFMLPGVLLAVFFMDVRMDGTWFAMLGLGLLSACLIASSNYVINEILDAEKDRHHPDKQHRPIPSGRVRIPFAWAEWLLLAATGLALASRVNGAFLLSSALLWFMGLAYNVPPLRCKDRPYVDVLCESINNPIRLAMGWFAAGAFRIPTLSVVLAYWMFGAYLMAVKRFAEYRHIACPDRAGRYRKSFAFYTEQRLLISILFYAALFGMFSGVFMARYRMELVLATPVVAFAMAFYLHLGYAPNSPVQYPESLYRQKSLSLLVSLAFALCGILLFLDLPAFASAFSPDYPPTALRP